MNRAKGPGIIITKARTGLSPVAAIDAEQLAGFRIGTEFEVRPLTKRSLKQARLYWATLGNVLDATALSDVYPTSAKLHEALLRDLGFVTVTHDLDGKPHLTRDSTAFDAMDASEFRNYFDKAMCRLAEVIGTDPLTLHDTEARERAA